MAFVSCSATGGGACGGIGNDRVVTFGSLGIGESVIVTLVAKVNTSAAIGTTISNTATISAGSMDQDLSNNSMTQANLSSPSNNGQPIPQPLGDIAPGASAMGTLTFSNPGTGNRLLRIRGTYGGGTTFSKSQNVVLP